MKTVTIIKKILITAIIISCAIPTISKSAALPLSIEARAAALKEARAAAIPAQEQNSLNKELIRTVIGSSTDDPSHVQDLIKRGSDPNAFEEVGLAPLLPAVLCKKINMLQLLISAGADLNTQHITSGETALMFIAQYLLEHPYDYSAKEIMHILIQAGADLNIQNYHGNTVLMYTIENAKSPPVFIINLLINAGADINAENYIHQNVLQLAKQMITDSHRSQEAIQNAIAARDTLVEAIAARDRATQECARTWLMQSQDYLMKKPLPIPPLTNIMQEYAIPTSCDPVAVAKQRSADATIQQLERAEETLERTIIFRSIAAEQGLEAAQAWALATKRRT